MINIKRGFTLIEMVVVIAILAVAGLLILNIFTQALRGSNKAQILSSIKKNGQAILESMDKTVRGAQNVVCIGNLNATACTNCDSLVIEQTDKYVRFRITAQSATSNGIIQQEDLPKPPPVPPSDPKYSQAHFCSDPSVAPITLTDTNPQTGASILSGSFSRNTQAGFRDVVTIEFILKPGILAPEAVAGQVQEKFSTSVGLR